MRKRHIEPAPDAAPAEPANEQAAGATFTIPELAKRWRTSRHTIMIAIRAGRLHAFRVGERHYRIREDEVLRYEHQNHASAVAS